MGAYGHYRYHVTTNGGQTHYINASLAPATGHRVLNSCRTVPHKDDTAWPPSWLVWTMRVVKGQLKKKKKMEWWFFYKVGFGRTCWQGQVRPHPLQTLLLQKWESRVSRTVQKFRRFLKWFCTWARHPRTCDLVLSSQWRSAGSEHVAISWSSQLRLFLWVRPPPTYQ